MQWSINQKRAIDALGKNVVVSASAGAGKTAVLTERLTKRVAHDHIPVTSILAMTFTEAAAAEMKSRLFTSLSDLLRKETRDNQREYLQDQLVLLGSAHVSTIHSFCLSLIKENYFMINLDPKTAGNILSDEECLQLKEDAWNKAIDEMLLNHKESFIDLCHLFSGRSDDFSSLKSCAMKLSLILSESENKEATLKRYKDYINPVRTLHDVHPDIMSTFMDACRYQALCIENSLDEALDIIDKNCLDAGAFKNDVLVRKAKLEPLTEALETHNYTEIYRILRNCCQSPLGRVTKIEELKPVRKKIMELSNNAVSFLIPEHQLILSINEMSPHGHLLIDFASMIEQNYSHAKKERNAMDFGDMEQFALQILLADNKRVAKKMQRQFVDILVDEFQDTNDVQNTIIELISRGNNIFRVGDIKQSIYRFRGARPQIMRELIQCQDSSQEIIFLSENYRSCKSIVEFNNYLFNILMNINGLSQEYSSSDWVSVGTEDQDDHNEYPVEFHALTFQQQDNDEEMGDLKADYIAREILSMKEKTSFKKWSDYCVLVRSHAVKDKLRYSFDKYGIPNSMAVKSGFYKSVSLQEIISFFKLLLNPHDDLSLVALLTSSMFKINFETLSNIRIENKNRSYYDCLNALNHDFIRHYHHILDVYQKHGLFRAFQAMIDISDYYFMLSVQEKTNLDLFADRLYDFEQKYGSSLIQYLSFLSKVEDQPTSEAISSSTHDDVVRIMTVHQSKGLQFPVVFFWSTMGTRIMDNLEKCMLDSSLGLGLMHISQPLRIKRPTLHRLALEHHNTIEEFEENIRLLYVATTRPQKKLILVDQVKDNYVSSPVNLAMLNAKKGFSDMLLSGMNQFDCYQRILPVIVQSQKIYKGSSVQSTQSEIYRYDKTVISSQVTTPSSFEAHQIPDLNLTGNHANVRGTTLHEVVEQLPKAPWTYDQIFASSPDLPGYDIKRLIQLGNHPLFVSLQNQTIYKEYSFIVRHDTSLSHGFIDYLAHDDNTVTLIDFKSDRHVTCEFLKERYQGQIDAYLDALKMLYPDHHIEAYLYSFELNEMIKMD